MKKLLTFLTLLTLFFTAGWAEESLFYKLDGTITGGTNGYATVSDITQGSMTWKVTGNTTINPWRIGGNSINQVDRPVYSTTAMGNAISKVSVELGTGNITIVQVQLIVASDAQFNNSIQTQSKTASFNSTIEFTPAEGEWPNGAYYKLNFLVTNTSSSNQYLQLKAVNFYKNEGGSTTETCATPTFSPAAGSYTEAQTVTITSETEGATIYYTTDGNDPTTSSSSIANGGTVGISNSCTLKAMAVATGHNNSAVASAAYTIITDNTPANAITTTFVASEDVGTNSSGAGSITKSPLTFACTSCNLSDGSVYRLYSGSTTTISAPEGYTIYKIVFTPASGYSTNLLSSTTGSYISGTGTWLGEAESVSFSASAQFRCTAITVYYSAPDVTSNIYRVIKTNGETSNTGGWLGNWTNCTLPDGVSGTDYVVTADAGATVQFKAGTNDGFQILAANVSAVDANNNVVALTTVTTEDSGITFSFTMPASEVTITANFTTYRPTLRMAGRFNGGTETGDDSRWVTDNSGPVFTYDATNDKYTLDVYFIGASNDNGTMVDYFYFRSGNSDLKAQADGNYWVTTLGSDLSNALGGSANFRIEPGVYTITINGERNTIRFDKLTPEITFSPASGEVATGTSVSATSTLTDLVAAVKAIDSDASGDVTVQVSTDGNTYSDNVTLTADATVTAKASIGNIVATGTASYTVVSSGASGDYVKVTSTEELTDGEYLIVYESGNVAFNGGLETLDAVNNTINVTIADDKIVATSAVDAAAFTITTTNGSSTIHSASGYYIGKTASGNGLDASEDTEYTNTITFNNGNVVITASGNSILRYNSASNQNRFRYYGSGQQAIQLYKKSSSNKSTKPTITPATGNVVGGSQSVTITAADGATIYYTTDGSTPTTSSTVCSDAFEVTGAAGTSVTVKAIAVESGKDASAVASATYTFVAPSRPTFSPASGTSSTSTINVTIESEDNGTIYYVINPENAPTAGAAVVSAGTEYSSAISLSEVGTYTIYAAVRVNGIVSSVQSATYTITSSGGGQPTGDGDYVKVTSDADLTDGEYLIVYEGDGFEDGPYALNGALSLSTLDAASNYISVEINDYTIPSSETVDAAVFTFNAAAGTFVNSNGVYIGASSNANTITTSTDPLTNTVSIDEDYNAVIMGSGGAYLRYNANDGRFRYYKSSSYSSQKPIALYKKVASTAVKAPTISPEGGTFLNSQYPNGITVTVSPVTEGSTIYVSTDGTNYTPYTAATTLTITETTTVSAYATKDDVTSETVSETYNLVDVILEDVQFSPIPGTYSGAQTLQMYTTNQNAKIYYTTDDSTPSATNGTLYSGEIAMAAGNVYNFKAIAVLGNNTSDVAEGTYTINTASTSGLNSIAQLNAASTGNTKITMNNPVQVIYMSTWRHKDGTNNEPTIPEYAYIRDNTGYSLVYFGNGWYNTWDDAVDNPKICEMGDWIPAGVLKGAVQVWSDGFHNELGGRNNATTITGWPTATNELQNTPIIPEEMTNTNINAGWSAPSSFATEFNEAVAEYVADNNLSDNPDDWTSAQESAVHAYAAAAATNNEGYIKYVEDGNVWGHYVHLRKNTIRVSNTNVAGATDGDLGENGTRKKYSGFITDQSGDELTYYDSFYNFSGFNGTPDYSNDFFQNIQNNGGTFDVYGIVGFYGPKAADEESSYSPFELFPIDFLYIYKPVFNITSGTYYDTQEVTLSCATEGATIWYKTSDMEDYAEYTGPITVDATTTIEAYSSIPTKYNDIMESIVNTIDVNIGNLDAPVISPESQVKTVGETVDATITCATEGATIYFTVDGSDPRDENSARYEYTSENIAEYLTGISQTTTVRAIAYLVDDARQTSYYSREAEAKTYTFVKTNGIIYTLVTDQTQLNESSVYVIVNKANHMAMSVAQNDNNRGATGVKFVDEATKMQVEGNGDVALFMLTKIGNKWYIKTNNSDVNGYLAVGDGNLLLTNAAADDNAEATINIDADAEHQAHISFAYNNALTRYMRYWLGGQAFSTYTSETSNLPVSLYYLAATPLANIEKEGTTENGKNQYTIADQLIGVWADATHGVLWCKDQGDASIDKTYIKDGQVDFMKHSGVQAGEWDQSNWVALQFTTPNSSNNIDLLVSNAVGKYIKQATVQGYYVDDVNFTIRMAEDKLELVEPGEVEYTKNVYCTTNFLPENLNIWGTDEDGGYTTGNTQNYFFMNPKIQEVCHITWAQWDAQQQCFTVPTASGFDGAFQVGWMYNQGGNVSGLLQDEVQYEFDAIVQRASKTAYGPKDKVTTPNYGITVLPLNLSASSTIVTAINTVDVNGKAVKSVKYVNVAGMVSDKPFSGVNIVVTEYTDGSRSTTKMLRK